MGKAPKTFEKLRKLEELSKSTDIPHDLPQVIVIGSQSSGKSSVLEQIIQKDILPRGSELVTRCPIIIHLRPSEKEYATIENKRFTDFECVEHEIRKITEKNCGKGKNVSNKPIEISLHFKNAVKLTLIDLPGITKIPVDDQPKEIESQILEIVEEYASKPNTFIVAVIPANVDIATCDSLKLANKFDPKMERTLGVVTKIDLMDTGTNCVQILNNITYPLKHGYVGILCRNQSQIESRMSVADALIFEENFFKQNSTYKKFSGRSGSKFLGSKLSELFVKMVHSEFGKLEENFKTNLKNLNLEKRNLGTTNKLWDYSKNQVAFEYCKVLRNVLEGSPFDSDLFLSSEKGNFNFEVKKLFKDGNFDFDTSKCVLEEMKYSTSLFLSEKIMKNQVFKKMAHLKQESLRIINEVHLKLLTNVHRISVQHNSHFTKHLNDIVEVQINSQKSKLDTALKYFADISFSTINYDHPDFSAGRTVARILENSIKKKKAEVWSIFNSEDSLSINSDFEYKLLVTLIDEYFLITKKAYLDFCLKAVNVFYLKFVDEDLQLCLSSTLSEISSFKEDPEVLKRREELSDAISKISRNILDLYNVYDCENKWITDRMYEYM